MGLTEKTADNRHLTGFPGRIPINYLYTFGLAGEEFFRSLKDKGRLLSAECPSCGTVYLPSRIFCEKCMVDLEKAKPAASTGEVYTFAICHEGLDGAPLKEPEVIAAIAIDGTDGVMTHYVRGIDPSLVHIGMRVEMVLKPAKKRVGNIFDIECFKPTRK